MARSMYIGSLKSDIILGYRRYRVLYNVLGPVLWLVAQSCLTLCNPMDCSPPGSSVPGDSLAKNAGVGCHALLQVAMAYVFPNTKALSALWYVGLKTLHL